MQPLSKLNQPYKTKIMIKLIIQIPFQKNYFLLITPKSL